LNRIARRAAIVILAIGASAGTQLAMSAAPANAATKAKAAVPSLATMESQVVTLVNQQRAANGCGALRDDAKLHTAAANHSADMAANNYFSHTGLNGSTFVGRVQAAGYGSPVGENIAWGWRTPQDVMNAWMNSAPHKANILNCSAKAIGVGVARKADGTPYWTQEFGSI
jgi:uncharacterized protein YkwD